MQESVGDVGGIFRHQDKIGMKRDQVIGDGGNVTQPDFGCLHRFAVAQRGHQEHDNIHRDQPDRHILQPDMFQAVCIMKRDEHVAACPLPPVSPIVAGDP